MKIGAEAYVKNKLTSFSFLLIIRLHQNKYEESSVVMNDDNSKTVWNLTSNNIDLNPEI